MSYSSDIGLDLFTMPFRRTQNLAYNRPQQTQISDSRLKVPILEEEKSDSGKVPEKSQAEKDNVPETAPEQKSQAEVSDTEKPQLSLDAPAQSKKELILDMSDGTVLDKPMEASEETRRKEHEESEAKRKAEWEARQSAKKQEEEASIQKLQSMSDADIVSASAERMRADTEKLTRRNMKECVSDYLQSVCQKDPAFARKTMHPKKSMIHCFKYINRMAKEYIMQEMKDNDLKPENGIYGSDVPDDLCYQWAVDYFNDPDAQEDKEKEEKFIPRPYVSTTSKAKKIAKMKKSTKKEQKKSQELEKGYEQMSLMEGLK